MDIEMLWGQSRASKSLEPTSRLGQALMYGSSVHVIFPTRADAREIENWGHLKQIFSDDLTSEYLDEDYYFSNSREAHHFATILCQEAHFHLINGNENMAFHSLRCAAILTNTIKPHSSLTSINISEFALESLKSSGLSPRDSDLRKFIIQNKDYLEGALVGKSGARDRARTEKLSAIFQFCQRSLVSGAYPLVDDARGVWASAAARQKSMGGRQLVKGVSVSLAVGQVRRLPSIRSTTWESVVEVRRAFQEPLSRFRRAMVLLSENAQENPFDPQFDEFVDDVWIRSVAPALAELDEMAREAQYRRIFFSNVIGDLSSYAGPTLAISAASLSDLPAMVEGVVAVSTPILNVIGGRSARLRAMASKDFYFLHAVENRMKKSKARR